MASLPSERSFPCRFSTNIFVAILFAVVISFPVIAQAQTLTSLHAFTGGLDGGFPESGVTLDRAGNLEGTAFEGGSAGLGAAYKLVHNGANWTASALHEFTGGTDGARPAARVMVGPDGSLYGTTVAGGSNSNCGEYTGCGTVFQLSPPASICKAVLCPWNETVLYRFPGGPDGGVPGTGDILFDRQGNIYGTTQSGGAHDAGTVYMLTPSNGTWVHSVIYSFTGGQDGGYPMAGVIADAAGNLYGTTQSGGSGNGGTIYELSPSGSGWSESTLHALNSSTEGAYIQAGLIFDSAGNLYGAAAAGGPNGSGTVFQLAPSGDNWNFTVLYANFGEGGGYEGPAASLAIDQTGALYGTSVGWNDGNNFGTIFKLTPSNGGWVYTLLLQFNLNDGGMPFGGVTLDAGDNLYGTTSEAAASGGTVWMLVQ
ncbi:MAG: choice-of-anchor tandem repeat GloVer-containing protein [Candidatus Korobacteraceae bacterium]|jgi:uncharacterized repeat protein (TIGR03803 family)